MMLYRKCLVRDSKFIASFKDMIQFIYIGCISSKAFPKITPGTILHGCGEKTVLVIEKDDSEVQNLTPLVDTNKNNSPGIEKCPLGLLIISPRAALDMKW